MILKLYFFQRVDTFLGTLASTSCENSMFSSYNVILSAKTYLQFLTANTKLWRRHVQLCNQLFSHWQSGAVRYHDICRHSYKFGLNLYRVGIWRDLSLWFPIHHVIGVVHDDVITWKYFLHYWPYVKEIHCHLWIILNNCQWCGALMIPLMSVWRNYQTNSQEACELTLNVWGPS